MVNHSEINKSAHTKMKKDIHGQERESECVCDRERQTNTHTHTQRERERERERERGREPILEGLKKKKHGNTTR